MLHDTELIGTITAGLVLAFVAGFIAIKLRLPAIVGYLLAGVAIGPFTPGYVGDTELAPQLAEIGVILLMFGVGIHFSVKDLLSVRSVAIPGAIVQVTVATGLATLIAMAWGWSFGEGLVLGLSISVASTVVLLRALSDIGALNSASGRVAVGWLIVEDLFTVLVLVMLPILATSLGGVSPSGGSDSVWTALPIAIGKVGLLTIVMFVVGTRVVPWVLQQVARTGSRELFTLAVLAAALGIAWGSGVLFDVSLALGAFLAGLVVGQSQQSHQAAADALPFRDAFAVLFFVSVGMLFDPAILLDEPARLLAVLGVILIGKSLAALGIVLALGHTLRTGLVVAAGLAQIGEFSFILASLGHGLELLSDDGNNLILAAAIFSIALNPLLFRSLTLAEAWASHQRGLSRYAAPRRMRQQESPVELIRDHTVFCGYGRVGAIVADALDRHGVPYVVLEKDQGRFEELQRRGIHAIYGDASNAEVLRHAHLEDARAVLAITGDGAVNALVAATARQANPNLHIIVRAHGSIERARMRDIGIGDILMSDIELGMTTIRRILPRLGVSDADSLETMRQLQRELRFAETYETDAGAEPSGYASDASRRPADAAG